MEVSESRSRRRFRDIDVFPKVEENYQQRSSWGGLVTTVVIGLVLVIMVSELLFFESKVLTYQYSVDPAASGQLQVNMDISIAMPCDAITISAADVAHTAFNIQPFIRREPTAFSAIDFTGGIDFNKLEGGVSSLIRAARRAREQREKGGAIAGCRLHGVFYINKVDGLISIAPAGHGGGHGHGKHVPHNLMNVTHRIDRLSFGENFPGVINPLDGAVEVADSPFYMYQYFLSLVPTVYQDSRGNLLHTNQYAVTDHAREVDHSKGSHGTPGLLFKYSIEAIRVTIQEQPFSFLHTLTRLCGIIGGVFATAGIIHRLGGGLLGLVKGN